MKFAVLSHVLPPAWSGQAMMLWKLLAPRDPSEYILISGGTRDGASAGTLPARRYNVARPRVHTRVGLPFTLLARSWRLASILRRERCSAVVACTGDLYDLPTAFVASRLARARFYPYLFDDFAHQWPDARHRAVARALEPTLVRRSHATIVPNEFLRDALEERYGVTPTIVRNACDLTAYDTVPPAVERGTIVYTGAVYGAQIDALAALVRAIGFVNDRGVRVRLHLHTSASVEELAARGLAGPVTVHGHRAGTEMPAIQRAADVLFLPLSFAADYHAEVIRTAAPGKMGEYLAARRPILAHAPRNSFVSWYFRKYDCGLVVDEPDDRELAAALERLLGDHALRDQLTVNAGERARVDFDIGKARRAFESVLGP
jgi:glycosyltransferase involved in cell wall biosynthesis